MRIRMSVVGSALVVATLLGSAAIGSGTSSPGPDVREPSLQQDPCAAVMSGIRDARAPDRLGVAGLADTLPAPVLGSLEIASWTCLADRVAGNVEAVVLRLRTADGLEAGLWFLLRDALHSDTAEWHNYALVLRDRPMDFLDIEDGLVAAEQTAAGRELLTVAAQAGPAVSAWEALQAAFATLGGN